MFTEHECLVQWYNNFIFTIAEGKELIQFSAYSKYDGQGHREGRSQKKKLNSSPEFVLMY